MSSSESSADDALTSILVRALGAQYEVGRRLGRGGMGSVYLAREPFLDRHVAVKVLSAELTSGEARERFLREARTAARLSHPHIVPLYTFGHADNLPYYVMGYVDGESLESRLRREGRLPPDDVRRIVGELADALDYAHRAGVVHRDVKPDNVLLDRATGRALLTDFGVAKRWTSDDSLTVTGVIVGTAQYMSPEQASGEREIDGRSDVYSLGVMAYRMATGRLPFEGDSFRQILVQHATRTPVPARRLVESLPLDLDTAIGRALAKDRSERWQSAGALRSALLPGAEESVPEDMQALGGLGVTGAIAFAIMTEIPIIGGLGGSFEDAATIFTALGALSIPLITVLGLVPAARKFGWRSVLRQAFRQPRIWSFWWPRSLRRAGDVWDRLPSIVRRTRLTNGLLIALAALAWNVLAIGMVRLALFADGTVVRVALGLAFGAILPLGAAVGWLDWKVRKLGRAAGLTKREASRLSGEATWNASFWTKPHIAALLHEHGEADRVPAPALDSADLVRQIVLLANVAKASPHADVYDDAREAALAIQGTLERCDHEIGLVSRDADPRERERIRAALDALGEPGSDESTARRQMRELLERQLQLFGEIQERLSEAADLKAHLSEQLRILALQVARLRSEEMDPAISSEISERIRLLMHEIEHRVHASVEVKKLLAQDPGTR